MLTIIAIILMALWGLGMATANSLGGFIHVLLIASFAVILVRIFKEDRVV